MTAVIHESAAAISLKRDYLDMVKNPVPHVTAHPLQTNIFEWRYVIVGPAGTPYENGIYYGKVIFPEEFPFEPPTISMITPSGRFKCNTELNILMSHFEAESWNPTWTVSTILRRLLSLMVDGHSTSEYIYTSDFEKQLLAKLSLNFNLKDPTFCELFPGFVGQEGKDNGDIPDQEIMLREKKKDKVNFAILGLQIIVGPQQNAQRRPTRESSSREVGGGQQQDGQDEVGSDLVIFTFVIVGFAAFIYAVCRFYSFCNCYLR